VTVDRWGRPIRLGWPRHHLVWIEAALTLPKMERLRAYEDISSLTGRSLTAVLQRAAVVRREQKIAALTPLQATRIEIPAEASIIRRPDMARLMAGR
jgi:hypothetical protein